ncbi:phasin family protein [Aestuariivirga sp.]|uniref:phasin family protein n=1 Tax=Aestuariivirga sp. TaxID=2650926 RepID=UPI0039E7072D
MAKKVKTDMNTEIPAEVTAFAQKSVDQAQAAFEKANDMVHGNAQVFDAAASAYKARLADIQLKAMEITQINVNSAFAFARKLFAVKEPTEFFAVNQDFAKAQAEAFQRQAAELNELSVLLAKETVKPMQDGFSKTFGDLTKSMAA